MGEWSGVVIFIHNKSLLTLIFIFFLSAPAHTSTSINWTAATKNSFDYLRMGNCNREVCPKGRELEFAMEKNPFTERLKLWRELNSLLNPSSESVPQHIEL